MQASRSRWIPSWTVRTRRPTTWTVLRHWDFQLLLLGQFISGIATFMQIVGQSLLVLQFSDNSMAALGMVSLAQALAFFAFSLTGGRLVDRVDKRRVLFVTQSQPGRRERGTAEESLCAALSGAG